MRATACVCALLSVSLALPVAGARADIKPLPKPAVVSPTPAGSNRGSLIAPVSKPAVSSIVKPDAPQVTKPPPVTATTARRQARAPALSFGGREQPQLADSGGGRAAPALTPVVLAPTPLGMAGADESPPAFADAWPRWMFALLALLALAEAGVLAQLVRSSKARAGRA
jgi:hypothetical protein